MEIYNGGIVGKIFVNGDSNYLTDFNDVLKDIFDHTHQGSGAGVQLHGTLAIQAGTIGTASIADGAITSAKLAALTDEQVIANNAYKKWRNAANSADLSTLRVNTSDHIEFNLDIDKARFGQNITIKGAKAGGSDLELWKTNVSDQWELLSSVYTQHVIAKATNTYDLGTTLLFYNRGYISNLRLANGGGDLDWYESTTFTPTIKGSGSVGTASYSAQNGWVVRIGKAVIVAVQMAWTGGTGSGSAILGGLPHVTAKATAMPAGFTIGSAQIGTIDGATGNINAGGGGGVTYTASGNVNFVGTYLI